MMNISNNEDQINSKEHPAVLIPELCLLFYQAGWFTGTSGSVSMKLGNEVYISPAGIEKENLSADDLFIQDINSEELQCPPAEKKLKKNERAPIFMLIYKERKAGAVIHSLSRSAVLVTLSFPGNEFRISYMEMIKGIKNQQSNSYYRYDQELVVPIIEYEDNLEEKVTETLLKYPQTTAVLVRKHGVYVWGDTWQEAKTQAECYDYLFDIAVRMKSLGLNVNPEKLVGFNYD